MNPDSTYYVMIVTMALAVIITCGAGITWNYFSAARWSKSKGEQPSVREHHENSPFADRSTDRAQRDDHQLAA
jgi:hypothetical protein